MTPALFENQNALTLLTSTKKVFAFGFSLRKRKIVRQFTRRDDVVFIDSAKAISADSILLLWGRTEAPKPLSSVVQIIRLEDGFLRSVGLGADLIQPMSWVMDARGIYFDATQSSDLEHILETASFDEALLTRAEMLAVRIVKSGMTKYNVGAGNWSPPASPRQIILVPGQVETDASIKFGALNICRNIDLLQAVRAANPDAYVVYKPHPDVLAGLRGGGSKENTALSWCDEVVTDIGMADLLDKVHEVHTMTSLTGFEALLRGKRVMCYGAPFYSGWGLTEDHLPVSRRTRRLSLNALVAGVLLLYPTYISRNNGQPISPEQALDELESWRESAKKNGNAVQKAARKVSRLFLRRP
jgi:capsular polysaccharide export protein